MISIFCLILAFNPIFFLCSLSFMTDIPFLVLMIISSAYFYSFLNTEKTGEYSVAVLFCIGATLIRQLAIIIPLSFFVAWLVKKGISFKSLLVALFPLIVLLLTLKIYNTWYYATQNQSNLYGERELDLLLEIKSNLQGFMVKLIVSSFTYLFYVGLFLFPAIMAYILKIRDKKLHFRFFLWFAIILSALVLTVNLFLNTKYPFENVISILGSNGPGLYLIFDGENYLQSQNLTYKWILRFFIIIGATGTSGLFFILYGYGKLYIYNETRRSAMIFVMLLLISNTILISTSVRFDRYLLTLLPLLLFIIYKCLPHGYPATNKKIILKTCILTILFLTYTVAGTYHFFSWNKARWKGLYWLTDEKKISPEDIDGGFEFNGWHHFDPGYQETNRKNWYWVQNNLYVVAFRPKRDYVIERPLPYFNLLKFRTDSLFVLKKNNKKLPDL